MQLIKQLQIDFLITDSNCVSELRLSDMDIFIAHDEACERLSEGTRRCDHTVVMKRLKYGTLEAKIQLWCVSQTKDICHVTYTANALTQTVSYRAISHVSIERIFGVSQFLFPAVITKRGESATFRRLPARIFWV
jgi:hypothetical protein